MTNNNLKEILTYIKSIKEGTNFFLDVEKVLINKFDLKYKNRMDYLLIIIAYSRCYYVLNLNILFSKLDPFVKLIALALVKELNGEQSVIDSYLPDNLDDFYNCCVFFIRE